MWEGEGRLALGSFFIIIASMLYTWFFMYMYVCGFL